MAVKGVKDVMNKAKVMTATATLVAGLGVVSHVNADEVDLSSTTQNPEAQANQVESDVTKADVDAAKAIKNKLLMMLQQLLMKLNQHIIKLNNQLVRLKIL